MGSQGGLGLFLGEGLQNGEVASRDILHRVDSHMLTRSELFAALCYNIPQEIRPAHLVIHSQGFLQSHSMNTPQDLNKFTEFVF